MICPAAAHQIGWLDEGNGSGGAFIGPVGWLQAVWDKVQDVIRG